VVALEEIGHAVVPVVGACGNARGFGRLRSCRSLRGTNRRDAGPFRCQACAGGRSGPTARESVAATDHRQPTPDSIAAAEAKLGDLSPRTVEAIESGMTRARKADAEGNKTACEAALAEVQRAIAP
jgi:hypothetical protein